MRPWVQITDPCLYITAVAIRYVCCVKKLVGKQQKSGIGRKRTRDQKLWSYEGSKIYLSLPNWFLDWSRTTIRKIGTRERGRKLAEQQDIDKEEGGEPGGVESQQLWYRPKKAWWRKGNWPGGAASNCGSKAQQRTKRTNSGGVTNWSSDFTHDIRRRGAKFVTDLPSCIMWKVSEFRDTVFWGVTLVFDMQRNLVCVLAM